jgi:hypothetical protein
MYKNFNLTESEKSKILNMHKKYGYKKPLNEEMEDVDLGKRTSMDSKSDWGSNENDDEYNNPTSFKSKNKAKHEKYIEAAKNIKSILLDQNDGPVDDFVVISRAVSLAAKEPGYNNHNFTREDISNATFEALELLKSVGGRLDSNERQFGY